jgi:hypothetical protein
MFEAKKHLDKDRSTWERNPIKGGECYDFKEGIKHVITGRSEYKGRIIIYLQRGGVEMTPIRKWVEDFWKDYTTNINYLKLCQTKINS